MPSYEVLGDPFWSLKIAAAIALGMIVYEYAMEVISNDDDPECPA